MNFKSIIAFVLAGVVLGFGIHSAGEISTFLDPHAMLIVIGGTIAAGSISFQVDKIFLMFKVFTNTVMKGKKFNYSPLIEDLMRLAEAHRTNSPNFEKMISESKDYFLKEAMGAMMDDVMDQEDVVRVLRSRVKTMYDRHMDDVLKFKTVGKYPPAFGLMGTTLSMITLLKKLGSPGAQAMLGPAMALGLVATFYGLVLANMVFNPIAENLADTSKEVKRKNLIIVEGVRLIMAKTNPVVLAEELNSFLLPGERVDWKKLTKAGASRAA